MSKAFVERVLIIDDSDIDLFIQRRFMEVYQFSNEIKMYTSPEEALVWLKSLDEGSLPEIIFLDLNMPKIDGFEFLTQYQQSVDKDFQSKIKIVILTSSNSVKDRDQAFEFENVIQFCTKPLKQSDIDELKKMVLQER